MTIEVLKLDKFNEVNDEHPENILSKFVIFEIFKLDISNETKEEQPENIFSIYITIGV